MLTFLKLKFLNLKKFFKIFGFGWKKRLSPFWVFGQRLSLFLWFASWNWPTERPGALYRSSTLDQPLFRGQSTKIYSRTSCPAVGHPFHPLQEVVAVCSTRDLSEAPPWPLTPVHLRAAVGSSSTEGRPLAGVGCSYRRRIMHDPCCGGTTAEKSFCSILLAISHFLFVTFCLDEDDSFWIVGEMSICDTFGQFMTRFIR